MRTKSVILFAIFALFSSVLLAQEVTEVKDMDVKEMDSKDNSFYKNGLTVKALLLDYQSQNGGEISNINRYHHGFEVGYIRNLTDRISVGFPVKVGVVTYDVGLDDFHKTIIGIDVVGQYNFLDSKAPLIPYATLGYGYVSVSYTHLTLPTKA